MDFEKQAARLAAEATIRTNPDLTIRALADEGFRAQASDDLLAAAAREAGRQLDAAGVNVAGALTRFALESDPAGGAVEAGGEPLASPDELPWLALADAAIPAAAEMAREREQAGAPAFEGDKTLIGAWFAPHLNEEAMLERWARARNVIRLRWTNAALARRRASLPALPGDAVMLAEFRAELARGED